MSKKSRRRDAMRARVIEAREMREHARQRKYWTAAAAVGGVLALILVAALVERYIWRPSQPVAVVDGTTITSGQLDRYTRVLRAEASGRYQQAVQQLEQFANDPTLAQFRSIIERNRDQAQSDIATAAQRAYDGLVDNELIKQEATRRGVTVSEADLQAEVERLVAANQNWLTVPEATAQAGYAITATATAQAMPTATPTAAPTPNPAASPTVSATAAITPTPDVPVPTATPPTIMTADQFKVQYQNLLTYYDRVAGYSEADYRGLVRTELLRRKLQDIFAAQVDTNAEQVHVRHILLPLEQKTEAEAVLERLKKGESFEALAKELSTDTGSKEKGGELDWFPRGQMVKPFEDAAFALKQPGELSPLVESTFGFHILQLIDPPQVRPLEESSLAAKRSGALRDYLTELRNRLTTEGKLVNYSR